MYIKEFTGRQVTGMKLRIHGTEAQVTALGSGYRFAVWVQGCLRRCPGCISPDTWNMEEGYDRDTAELAEEILNSGCDGITISGGEPFLQAEALSDMLTRVRKKKDIGVIIYTGNTLEELKAQHSEYIERLLALCDLLVDGAYVEEQNDGKNLRGSSNQRALALTDRYQKEALDYGTRDAYVELFVHEDKIRMVGIPSKEMLDRMKKIHW